MSEFKIPPVSTLIGSTLFNYFKVLKQGNIEKQNYFKIALSTLVVLIATPFHLWEYIYFKPKLNRFQLKNPPLFILGHWRSGTTLLHNILSKDPNMAYLTTYQSVFPNNLTSKWIFKTFMKINMPARRPSDNVELNVNFPQEDEFAFSNSQANAYYNFFYFPKEYKTFYNKAVRNKGLSEKEKAVWYKSYNRLLQKAMIDSGKQQVLIKNPVNTARIKQLLKLYPDAKFIYLYRNPITVFYSTQRFFQKLYPTLWLHKVDNEQIDRMILDTYNRLMHDYQAQKELIPKENLLEIKFEDFESKPMEHLKEIYKKLLPTEFQELKAHFENYLNTQNKHKKNKYLVDALLLKKVKESCKYFMDFYDYDDPKDVEALNN